MSKGGAIPDVARRHVAVLARSRAQGPRGGAQRGKSGAAKPGRVFGEVAALEWRWVDGGAGAWSRVPERLSTLLASRDSRGGRHVPVPTQPPSSS